MLRGSAGRRSAGKHWFSRIFFQSPLRFKNGSSYFITLLASNVILFLVAVLAVVSNYLGYRGNTLQYVNSYNLALLSQIRNIMDERLNSVNRLAINISKNEKLVRLGYFDSLDSSEARIATVEALKALESYATVYSYLESAYVYYEDNGVIVSNAAFFKDAQTFCSYQTPEEENLRHWKHFMDGEDYFSYWSSPSGGQFTVAYRPQKRGRNRFYVVLNVDYSFLEQFGKDKDLFSESLLIAKNVDGETMFTLGSAQWLNEELYSGIYQEFEQLEGSRVFVSGDERVLATKILSADSRWSYYFMIPEDMFVKRATNILVLSLAILLLGICLILAVVLAALNMIPIRRLASWADANDASPQPGDSGNELEYVTQVIARSVNEYQKLKGRFISQIPVLQMHAVSQLLSGGFQKESGEYLASIGICFPHGYYYAAVFHFETAEAQGAQKQSLLAAQIRNAALAHASEELAVYMANADVSGEIAAIFNLEQADAAAALKAFYTRLLKRFNQLHTAVTLSVGAGVEDLAGLPGSYAGAVRTLQNRLLKAPGGIVFSEGEAPGKDVYYYPIDIEAQLMQSVKSGKMEQVTAILNAVIMENFTCNQISIEASRCLMFSMMGTAFRVLGSIGTGEDAVFRQQEACQKIFSCTNLQDMEVALRSMYAQLCEYVNSKRRQASGSLIDQIICYINGRYTDCNMSLTTVSAEVGLNPTYLSSYFKGQTGENFQSYLARIRLEASLKLLMDSRLPVGEIAVRVGYSNTAVFIRNFKKRYGVTPGQYRESHR